MLPNKFWGDGHRSKVKQSKAVKACWMLSSHHGAGLAHGVGVAEGEALGGGGGAERLEEAVGLLLVLLAEQAAGSEGSSGCEGTEAGGVSGLNHFLNRTRNQPRTHRVQKLIYWARR